MNLRRCVAGRLWRVPVALVILTCVVSACGDVESARPAPPRRRAVTPHVRLAPTPNPIAHPAAAVPSRGFNLILISIDTLRADHLSAFGYERTTSPNIDALAETGVLFEQAYSHSPKTTPSHMSLMTSLYPEVHRVLNRVGREIDSRLSSDIPTLAEILHDAGYHTAAFTAGGNMNLRIGFGRGFERYEHLPIDAAPTFEAGIEALRAWDTEGSAPFLLFLHTVQVHDPYLPPASHRDLFTSADYRGAIVSDATVLDARAKASGRSIAREFWSDVDEENPEDVQHLRDLYDACIRYTDDQIGRLLAVVDELGRAEDTAIVLLSDHGEEFREHGGTRHNSLFQELLHVPLIIRLPGASGAKNRRRITTPVRLVDVMPTLLELTGLPRPPHLAGESMLSLMGGVREPPRHVFAHWRERSVRSLRIGRWKLIRIPDALHVFDLFADPGERHPIETTRPDVRDSLARDLRALMERASATAETITPGDPTPIDPATRQELRALGYLE